MGPDPCPHSPGLPLPPWSFLLCLLAGSPAWHQSAPELSPFLFSISFYICTHPQGNLFQSQLHANDSQVYLSTPPLSKSPTLNPTADWTSPLYTSYKSLQGPPQRPFPPTCDLSHRLSYVTPASGLIAIPEHNRHVPASGSLHWLLCLERSSLRHP